MSASAQASNNRDSPFDRDEHWAGLGLDPDLTIFLDLYWIRTVNHLKKLWSGQDLDRAD